MTNRLDDIFLSAANTFLRARRRVDPDVRTDSDVLEEAAAWLDFYDTLIPLLSEALPLLDLELFDPGDEVQTALREIATRMRTPDGC